MKKQTCPVDVKMPSCGVFVLESHHAKGFRMEPSRHEFLELFYVMQGCGTIRIAQRNVQCRRDDVVVIPPGEEHSIVDDPDNPLSLYGVCIVPEIYALHDPHAPWCRPGLKPINKLALPSIRDDLRQMLYEQTVCRQGSGMTIVGLAMQLLGLLARDSGPAASESVPGNAAQGHAETVEQYTAQLREHFFEATDIDAAARQLGMSRRRFTHLFRESTGQTWLQFLTDRRVEHACRLLRQTDRTVTSIAFECGFEDLSSFYRAFNRRMKATPSKWRQG